MKPTPPTQPELEGLSQPREIVVSEAQLSATAASIRARGGVIEAWDVHHSSYTLHVRWPSAFKGEPCSCELCRPALVPSGDTHPALVTHDDAVE